MGQMHIEWQKTLNAGFAARLVISATLLICFLNPYAESLDYINAAVFMFSHYALFVAGFLISYRMAKLPKWVLIPVCTVSVFWHLPVPFVLSGSIPIYRLFEELSLFAAGLLAGPVMGSLSSKAKSALLGLWVIADTGLSIIFLVMPGVYAFPEMPISRYPAFQFQITGIAMIFFMNAVIALVAYMHVKRIGMMHRADK